MQFLIDQSRLNSALSKIAFALENKDELEAYTHIAIRGMGKMIRLTASNRMLDTEVCLEITGSVGEEAVGVSGTLLKMIVAAIPAGTIQFHLTKADLKIHSLTSMFTLPVMSAQRFTEVFPRHTDYRTAEINFAEIDMGELLRCFKKVMHCMNKDHSKPEYAAIHINEEHFVVTDGYRMAIYPNDVFSYPAPLLLHAAQVPRLVKVFTGLSKVGGLAIEDNSRLHLTCGGISCGTRLKAGTYPNYRQVVPEGPGIQVKAQRSLLLESLRRTIIVCPKAPKVLMTVDAGAERMTLKASSDLGKADEVLPCLADGDHEVTLNGKFMVDALMQLEEDSATIHLYYNGDKELSMVAIREGDYRNVILPVRG